MGAIGKFLGILSPFFAGIFIAYLLYMPCKNIEKAYLKSKNKWVKKRARSLSVTTVYLIVTLLIIILFNVILPVVIESVIDLFESVPSYFEIVLNKYNSLPEDSVFKGEMVQDTIKNLQSVNIKQYFEFDKVINYVKGAISAVTGIFEIFVAIVVATYFWYEFWNMLYLIAIIFKVISIS